MSLASTTHAHAACAAATGFRDPFAALNEPSLLRALKGQGPDTRRAYARLMERILPLLRQRLRRTFRDTEEAEDVLGETLMAVALGLSGFRGEARLTTWLYGVMQHKICDHITRLQRRRRLAESAYFRGCEEDGEEKTDPPTAWDASPDRLCDQRRFHQVVRNAMRELPPADAQAWTLREIDGLSADQAAERLAITSEAFRVRLFRARQRLAGLVKSKLKPESG